MQLTPYLILIVWFLGWSSPTYSATEPVTQKSDEPAISGDSTGNDSEAPRVANLLNEEATNDLHDDTTLLRNVSVREDDAGGLSFFDALRIWAGGVAQYDYYNFDGIYNHTDQGQRREGAVFRNLEGTLRAQLYDWGELKAQYDLDAGVFRDLYIRWVSEAIHTPITVTIGNQKEPMGLDYLIGNKFDLAQERSSTSDAFGSWRGKGVRLHRAYQLGEAEPRPMFFHDESAYITTSIGVFTTDVEKTSDTDFSVTGRITGGRRKDRTGYHFGLSGSYREGDFTRIRFKPEVAEADRIELARPDANTAGIAGMEMIYNQERLNIQAEAFYTNYRGRVDAEGGGGYLMAGWFLTEDSRNYNSRWGVVSPHSPTGNYSLQIFARASYTRADDELHGSNDYRSFTLGSNVHYRRLRGSINVVYGQARESINTEDSGLAINIRTQFLF